MTDTAPDDLKPLAHPGLTAAGAVVVGLFGAWLWFGMLVAPWELASGLADTNSHLNAAEKAISKGGIKAARYETLSAVGAANRARSGLERSSPLFDVGRLSSKIDATLEAAPHFVDAAGHSATAAQGALVIATDSLRGPNRIVAPDPSAPEAGAVFRLDQISRTRAILEEVRTEIDAARRALASVETSGLPSSLKKRVSRGIDRAENTQKVLRDAADGLRLLPAILGRDGPRTYLIGMQNPAELRGSGGAMLQFAFLEFDNGKPKLSRPKTVYDVDIEREQIDIPLPPDAWYVRGIDDAHRFGNANWSPDWPLTSKVTLAYARASGARLGGEAAELFAQVDGVISVDPVTMQELMAGVGRFRTSAGHVITDDNVVNFTLYRAYAIYPIPAHRRFALHEVVDGFYDGLIDPKHPSDLAQGLGEALGHKHMQIWMTDADEQAFIERMEWNGGLLDAKGGDYFSVVEQNVGGNKLDLFAHQEDRLSIAIEGDDAVHRDEIEIHNGAYGPLPRYVMGDSGPLHRPMLNVYVPPRAALSNASIEGGRLDDAAAGLAAWVDDRPAVHSELGKKVWSAVLEIGPQDVGAFKLSYRVPDVVSSENGRKVYRLIVQRQPKIHPQVVTIELRLPDGVTDVKASGWDREGSMLVRKVRLVADESLEVSWRE